MRKKEKKRREKGKEEERGREGKREKYVNTTYDLFILFGFPLSLFLIDLHFLLLLD